MRDIAVRTHNESFCVLAHISDDIIGFILANNDIEALTLTLVVSFVKSQEASQVYPQTQMHLCSLCK